MATASSLSWRGVSEVPATVPRARARAPQVLCLLCLSCEELQRLGCRSLALRGNVTAATVARAEMMEPVLWGSLLRSAWHHMHPAYQVFRAVDDALVGEVRSSSLVSSEFSHMLPGVG